LQLTNVQLTQSGFYTVVVTNAFGAVTSAPATLTVTTSPPWILTPPLSQSANVAAAIDFTVSAQGSLPLTYQWFFNNNAISGAGTTHLHLDNLQPSQAGAYTAVVTNAFGSATSPPAMLTVIAIPPTIERSPRSATTIPGGFADFTVSAAGSPPLSYQWFFNGSAILAASSAELYLTNVHVAQSGTYSVVVTNAFGAITSGPAILTVLETPPNHPTGTVVAWGDQVIPYALPGTRFTAIAAGGFHNLALKRDGTVAAWGDNEWGVSILPAGFTGVIAISTAEAQSLALKSDGTVVAWGYNPSGNHTVPTGLSGVIAIAQGGGNSLALRADGKVIAWGANDYGQGSVPGDLTGVVAISAGGGHNLALKSDGTVVAWGYNEFGQTNVPPGLRGVIAITAGALFHSLALKSDGTVVAWGYNAYGQANVPAGLSHVTAIAAGRYHNLALKSDGTVVAWGDNSYGQSMVPAGLTKVIALAAVDIHSLALRSDGTVVVWGDNTYGQSMAPAALTNFIALAAGAPFSGSGHTLALKSDGTVVAWGDDEFGQASVPSGLSNVVGIAAGLGHSLALMFDGTVEAWGYDSYGEADVPAGLRGVSAIAAGGYFSLALKSDGTVVAWGSNSHGETNLPAGLIGVTAIAAGGGYGGGHGLALKSDGTVAAWGTYDQSTVPADLTDVAAVAAGQYHSLALKSNGTVVAWGDNGVGQTNVPANLRGVVAIAAGGIQSLGLKSNDEVVAWGGDYSGETNVPAALTDVIAIAAGAGLSLALVSESPTLQSLPAGQTAEIGSTVQFRAGAGGCPPLAYQWLFNNATATTSSTTNCVLPLTNVQPAQAGAYTVVVTNAFGAVTSAPAMLSVIPAVERRMVPALSLFSQPGSSLNLEGADAFGPSPTWATFDNVLLTNTSQWYFDLSTPLPPQRFYRAWQSGPSSLAPALDLHVVPALTLTGAIGKAVRVDYINQFGPTDAWVTLDTVTLTNSWQLYFDLSAIGQAPRLWRLTTVP
jgi:alpha-tubulin suppressor-like RCC1 family protein